MMAKIFKHLILARNDEAIHPDDFVILAHHILTTKEERNIKDLVRFILRDYDTALEKICYIMQSDQIDEDVKTKINSMIGTSILENTKIKRIPLAQIASVSAMLHDKNFIELYQLHKKSKGKEFIDAIYGNLPVILNEPAPQYKIILKILSDVLHNKKTRNIISQNVKTFDLSINRGGNKK